jgi:hypothetical protein
MKLVSFAIETWLGPMRRIGALIDGEQDGCIADFTSAYTNYFAAGNRWPIPDELAQLHIPPDMIGWLRGGHKSRKAAEQAVANIRRR